MYIIGTQQHNQIQNPTFNNIEFLQPINLKSVSLPTIF